MSLNVPKSCVILSYVLHGSHSVSYPCTAAPLVWKVSGRAAPSDSWWWALCPGTGAEAVLGQPQTSCLVLGSPWAESLSGLVQMGRWWADGSCDGPGSSLAGCHLGFSPALASRSSSVGEQMGFFHRTWHFPHILIPSVNNLNESSTVLLLKQIPTKESACQPRQPPRYPSNMLLISQLIHYYVEKMRKWLPVSWQDTVIPTERVGEKT